MPSAYSWAWRDKGDAMKNIAQTLEDLCKNHGSYVPIHELERSWHKRTPSDPELFARDLRFRAAQEGLHLENDHVYLERVWQEEKYAAEQLSSFLTAPPLRQVELPATLRVGNLLLTREQHDAVAACLSNRLTLLLAKAGCGKTTVAQAIIENAGTENYLLCSPTGKAAQNLSDHTGFPAATVHRSLGVRSLPDFMTVERMEDIDLIIIDEGTMLTLDMLAGILRAAPEHCRIVIIGDRNQLPAVGPGDVINDLVDLGFPCAYLTENHRQSEESEALRHNVLLFDTIYWRSALRTDSSFYTHYAEDESFLMRSLVADAAGRFLLGERCPVLTLRRDDALEINHRIQGIVNPPWAGKPLLRSKQFTFVDGDRVMIVENDNSRCCYNGEVGTLHVQPDGGYSVRLDSGRTHEWPLYQVPNNILPAYAITIHRSQGSEYESVLMYIPRCSSCLLNRNSLYTGISRARNELVLYANPRAMDFGLHALPPVRRSALVEKTRALTLSYAE